MEEFEAFDLYQVVAALANVRAQTLLMVGDIHQRVELCKAHQRRATFERTGASSALSLSPQSLAEDFEPSETMSVAQSSIILPEERAWHEWTGDAEKRGASFLQAVWPRGMQLCCSLFSFICPTFQGRS